MNVKINKDGKFEFDVTDFLDNLPEEEKLKFIESLSCEEAIIKHVADQILTGWTENCYSGATGYQIEGKNALEVARRRVIELAPDVAKEEIDRLKRFAQNKEEEARKYRDSYFIMYHAWPEGYRKPKTEVF